MNSTMPIITMKEEGDAVWFGGGLVTFKVTSEQSGGDLCMIEQVASRGKRTPYHLHPDHDEIGYVLEGELLLNVNGVEHIAGAGAAVYIPRGTPHALLITSESARAMWICTPGTAMEAFFRQAGDVATSRTLPSIELDIARVRMAGEQTGAMKTLGAPPFPEDA